MYGFHTRLPVTQILLGGLEDLARLVGVVEGRACVAGDDGGVIEEVEETATVAGEDDLFFSAFDGRGEVEIVGFFEFLAGLCGVSWYGICKGRTRERRARTMFVS